MRYRDHLLVCVYVALAAAPVIAMSLGLHGRELFGVLPPTPRPALAADAVLSEQYQRELTSWFESDLGLKGTSIALDNALLYHVFRETRFGAPVRIGKDGVLFPDEDINYYNKHGRWIADPAYVDRLAYEMADAQHRLAARGRAFVPVIIPAKTSIWRDKIPERWKRDIAEPRHADEATRLVRVALARHGVRYVDAVELLQRSPVPREDLFGPDARHWTIYGACLALRGTTEAYAALTGAPLPPHECELSRDGVMRHRDNDLLRLLNARWVYRTYKQRVTVRHPERPPPAAGPRVLFVGTSFTWLLLYDAMNSGLYPSSYVAYYNKTFVTHDSGDYYGTTTAIQPGTPAWREIVTSRDLIALDLFESYLAGPGSYVETFLTDLLAELDRQDAATRAR